MKRKYLENIFNILLINLISINYLISNQVNLKKNIFSVTITDVQKKKVEVFYQNNSGTDLDEKEKNSIGKFIQKSYDINIEILKEFIKNYYDVDRYNKDFNENIEENFLLNKFLNLLNPHVNYIFSLREELPGVILSSNTIEFYQSNQEEKKEKFLKFKTFIPIFDEKNFNFDYVLNTADYKNDFNQYFDKVIKNDLIKNLKFDGFKKSEIKRKELTANENSKIKDVLKNVNKYYLSSFLILDFTLNLQTNEYSNIAFNVINTNNSLANGDNLFRINSLSSLYKCNKNLDYFIPIEFLGNSNFDESEKDKIICNIHELDKNLFKKLKDSIQYIKIEKIVDELDKTKIKLNFIVEGYEERIIKLIEDLDEKKIEYFNFYLFPFTEILSHKKNYYSISFNMRVKENLDQNSFNKSYFDFSKSILELINSFEKIKENIINVEIRKL